MINGEMTTKVIPLSKAEMTFDLIFLGLVCLSLGIFLYGIFRKIYIFKRKRLWKDFL